MIEIEDRASIDSDVLALADLVWGLLPDNLRLHVVEGAEVGEEVSAAIDVLDYLASSGIVVPDGVRVVAERILSQISFESDVLRLKWVLLKLKKLVKFHNVAHHVCVVGFFMPACLVGDHCFK